MRPCCTLLLADVFLEDLPLKTLIVAGDICSADAVARWSAGPADDQRLWSDRDHGRAIHE